VAPLSIVNEEPHLASVQRAASGALPSNDLFAGSREPERVTHPDLAELSVERDDRKGVSNDGAAAAAATQASFTPLAEAEIPGPGEDLIEPQPEDFSFVLDELPPPAADVEAMAETKRMMAEIARAIEEAAQSVGRPDSFSMALRAGQLRIADRFPFLDPFAGEFEYLAGEIVFVGQATAEEFVVGLTEALKLAVEGVTRSTAYADRFRAYVTEDLRKLLARERNEFEKLGLDQVIEIGPMSGKSNVLFWLEKHGIPADDSVVNRIFDAAKQSARVLTDAEVFALCTEAARH